MTTVAEILNQSKTHKNNLHKYFYGGTSNLHKSLVTFKKHELNALLLVSIEKPVELCKFFNTSFFRLESIINNPIYKQYTIKKKKGGERQISEPDKKLKTIQKRLNYFLQAYYLLVKPTEVYGFVVNPHYLGDYCNIVENAKVHTGKKYVLNIDLKDFFPSITSKQVKDIFLSHYFNFNEQIATALTLLTTYEGKLLTGAPTSPVISNFICYQLDADLKNFSQNNELAFSRYADDLTFSSNTAISKDTILEIIQLIRQNNFEVNPQKLRLKTNNRKQTVTGLTVNDKVNVDRKLLKKIRAMLHYLTQNGVQQAVKKHFQTKYVDEKNTAKFIYRLEGYINFVGQVRGKTDSLYVRQKVAFERIFENAKK